jgi:hypothetical protein
VAATVTPDPVIASIAAAVAAKVAEAALHGGKEASAALVRTIRERFGRDKDAKIALETAQRIPEDEAAIAVLARELERVAAEDAAFAARIGELWPEVSAELSAGDSGVVNSVTGSVGGHLMQARDVQVEGGLRFGDVQRHGGE